MPREVVVTERPTTKEPPSARGHNFFHALEEWWSCRLVVSPLVPLRGSHNPKRLFTGTNQAQDGCSDLRYIGPFRISDHVAGAPYTF